ncbi:hypothetical protein BJV78DRAFT_1155168 [Lactifluus subvellereus]|nr:hypothetical protein BJV78DRAFT_1155168 [Lactifluus subvellereus]
MHFNHFIQSQERDFITCRYLIALIARGAAVLGANCQPGFDAVIPYLYGSTDLDNKNSTRFRKMDPFERDLLENQTLINQILTNRTASSPFPSFVSCLPREAVHRHPHEVLLTVGGCQFVELQQGGEPRFTSYDYWCSRIGPDLLQPVGKADERWNGLLDLPDQWSSFYDRSPALDILHS